MWSTWLIHSKWMSHPQLTLSYFRERRMLIEAQQNEGVLSWISEWKASDLRPR